MAKQLCQGVTIVHTVLLLWCWLLLLLLQCRPGGLSSLSSEDGPGREQAGACPFLQLAVICHTIRAVYDKESPWPDCYTR